MLIISALAGAGLLCLLQSYLYNRYWNKDLYVEIHFSNTYAIEGEVLELYETVINRKWLPLPFINLKFTTSRNLSFFDTNNSMVSDNFYRNDLLSILMYQKITRTLEFRCIHRGYYGISDINLICSNIFLTQDYVKRLSSKEELYVYPRQLDYNKIDILFQKMLGAIINKRFINEDPFEFRNIRDYQSYDNRKSINWKASAKTGALKVNVNEYTSSQQVKILLNLDLGTMWKYEDLEEESISIASTFAIAFINQGIPVSLCTNAKDLINEDILNVPGGCGKNHIRTIQETLSRIDTLKRMPDFVTTIYDEVVKASENDYIIVISSNQKDELQQFLSLQRKAKKAFTWIIPVNEEVKVTASEELKSSIFEWVLNTKG